VLGGFCLRFSWNGLTLTTDNGTHLRRALCRNSEPAGHHDRRTAYNHPEGNSYIERFHRSLKEEEAVAQRIQNFDQPRSASPLDRGVQSRPSASRTPRTTPHDARSRFRPNPYFKTRPLVSSFAVVHYSFVTSYTYKIDVDPLKVHEIIRVRRFRRTHGQGAGPGGWATLAAEYNAFVFFDIERTNWGCAISRAFRENLP